MEKKRTLYTEEGYKALVDELDQLKNVKMPKIKEDLARARSFGDLSENSEYDEAKDEQGKTVTRIAELEALLENAEVVSEDDLQSGVVNLGCTVKVYDYDMEEEAEYTIVGSNEADAMSGRISDMSPMGAAMMHAHEGDEVSFDSPAGVLKFKILSVTRTK